MELWVFAYPWCSTCREWEGARLYVSHHAALQHLQRRVHFFLAMLAKFMKVALIIRLEFNSVLFMGHTGGQRRLTIGEISICGYSYRYEQTEEVRRFKKYHFG